MDMLKDRIALYGQAAVEVFKQWLRVIVVAVVVVVVASIVAVVLVAVVAVVVAGHY